MDLCASDMPKTSQAGDPRARRVTTTPTNLLPDTTPTQWDWNHTPAEYPRDSCVHQLLEDRVRLNPSSIAVECGGRRLTYAELDARSNQLAGALRRRGVQAERLVGVYLERSPEMVVALLGILKAGGAYVPLDPAYPSDRIKY